jgi:acyl carrier protein
MVNMPLSKQETIKLKLIFDKILNNKIQNHSKLKLNHSKNWDSLRQIQLIINIEKEFKIKVKTSDVFSLSTFEKITKYLNKK